MSISLRCRVDVGCRVDVRPENCIIVRLARGEYHCQLMWIGAQWPDPVVNLDRLQLLVAQNVSHVRTIMFLEAGSASRIQFENT